MLEDRTKHSRSLCSSALWRGEVTVGGLACGRPADPGTTTSQKPAGGSSPKKESKGKTSARPSLGIVAIATFLQILLQDSAAAQDVRVESSRLRALDVRAAALNPPDKDIPEGDQMLYDEARRLTDEMRELRAAIETEGVGDPLAQVVSLKTEMTALFSEVAALDCSQASSGQLRKVASTINRTQNFIRQRFFFIGSEPPSPNPWDGVPAPPQSANDGYGVYCREVKSFIGDTAMQQAINKYYAQIEGIIAQEVKEANGVRAATERLVGLLEKRKAAVDTRIKENATKQQLGRHFWLLILIIGGFGVVSMLAVRLFNPDIQMEWVASGQVIQFVTVTVLLSVIMALGLASILKENTLGTLLGGIGGYVLSQGIGRAAARQAQLAQAGRGSELTTPSLPIATGVAAPVSAEGAPARPRETPEGEPAAKTLSPDVKST